MPSFIVVGYFIENYGYRLSWSSIIAISIIASVGFYLMTLNNKKGSTTATEEYS
ncbi:hypothetical protein ACUYOF_08450 [Photobacterium ganghwense]|uniref:hypothetical protein n=1 Tax=Photobacterium ganghwense TaxID=320778 RepID=UPI004057B16A